jgi:hypothetical protein
MRPKRKEYPVVKRAIVPALALILLAGSAIARAAQGDVDGLKANYSSYTIEQAASEGYVRDAFCIDAASFGQPAERGAMGYHATDESHIRGPLEIERPQALLLDAAGRVLGVEYEILADAVSVPPQLFGQVFARLPAHAGMEHEHYALHLWFADNPSGPFSDFNPNVACPPGSLPPPNLRTLRSTRIERVELFSRRMAVRA